MRPLQDISLIVVSKRICIIEYELITVLVAGTWFDVFESGLNTLRILINIYRLRVCIFKALCLVRRIRVGSEYSENFD